MALYHRLKRQIFSHIHLARVGLILFILLIISFAVLASTPAAKLVVPFFTTSLPQHSGRTNFLVLGVGGQGHEGPDLADSIILISIQPNTGEAVLISLPRDLWVPSLRAKINSAYHYGFVKEGQKGGLLLAKSAVSEITNQPIDYAVVIDFSTFSKAIDLLGGVDVDIKKSFTDPQYPIAGKENDTCDNDPEYKCRYEAITFTQGVHHMDGAAVLKFVRSRHSEDLNEGTDFARARRQERVITAIKTKLLKTPIRVYKELFNLVSQNIVTDIKSDLYPALARVGLKLRRQSIRSFAISEPDQVYNPPLSPTYDNQWVLLPKDNNPRIVYDFVSDKLK